LPAPFLAAANVGLFYQIKGDPIVPDAFLSLGVQRADDFSQRKNRSYFAWEFGKLPEVCIEIVSNQEGDELKLSARSRQKGKAIAKKELYAQIGVRYYVVFDPLQMIQRSDEMAGALLRVWAISADGYTELTPPPGLSTADQSIWLNGVGIGLSLWYGAFEDDIPHLWLRWCDRQGQVIQTGAERAAIAESKAKKAESKAQKAESKAQKAESKAQKAESKAQRLAERLQQLGIDPDDV
jgi:Putative restriction endonuclease